MTRDEEKELIDIKSRLVAIVSNGNKIDCVVMLEAIIRKVDFLLSEKCIKRE